MKLFHIKASESYTAKPEQSQFSSHTHDTYEIFYFISGNAEYSVEGNIYPLSHGDIVILNHMETHHLILKKNTPYTRIGIHFKPTIDFKGEFQVALMSPFQDRPLGCFNHFPVKKFPNNHWQYYLYGMCRTEDSIKKQVYLMALLQELADFYPQVKQMPTIRYADNILNITHYIDNHLSDPLTLEQICEHFYISKSQINRNFKTNLGTTVGDYILTKRLVMAKTKIQQGQKPSSVYLQCGFNDYSTFFKAYKKKFEHSPKEEKVSTT